MRVRSVAIVLVALVALSALAGTACPTTIGPSGPPVGSEGGPCTPGGGCDPGLECGNGVCLDPLDVGNEGEGEGEPSEGEGEPSEGEGEGEPACQGDEPAAASIFDCDTIPTATCAPLDENEAVTTCRVAASILRSGIFQAAFDCIEGIPSSQCAGVSNALNVCFGALTACENAAADNLCVQARDTCVSEGDNGFPLDTCIADLRSTNVTFREQYATCFNGAAGVPCTDVHDNCYNTALNALVGGG